MVTWDGGDDDAVDIVDGGDDGDVDGDGDGEGGDGDGDGGGVIQSNVK